MLQQTIKQATKKSLVNVNRRSISRTPSRMGGDGHHQHYVFEGEFSKKWVGGLTTFVVVGGVGVPVFLLKYQNWKNGFPQQEQ